MKTLLLAGAVGLSLTATPLGAQQLQSDLGGSAAHSCFESATDRRYDDGAIAVCTQALQQALVMSDEAGTFVNRGILFMRAGHDDLANRDYDQALAIDPRQPEAWLNKAVTMVNSGNSSTAVDFANRALQLRTQMPALAYYVRGLAYEEQGRPQAAYADLRNAAALAPNWSEPSEQLKRYHVVER